MSAPPQATSFAQSTAVSRRDDGRYDAVVDPDWFTPLGPNGGTLAAIMLRAMAAQADAKPPRSITCHYLRVPGAGPVEVSVSVERVGRAVSSLSARMTQDGEPCLVALAVFGIALPSAIDYADLALPDVPAADAVDPVPYHPGTPPIGARLEARPVFGTPPFSGGPAALSGGWIRMTDPYPADAFALCQYADGWLPSAFSRMTTFARAPTLDFTVHFRRTLPLAGDPLSPVLLKVWSDTSAEGYHEEDTAIWAPDGTLIAQSRQLALLRPAAR
jgi:acyl-CoA thioesterase